MFSRNRRPKHLPPNRREKRRLALEHLEPRWLMATADPDDTLSEAHPLGAITTTPVTASDGISPDTDVDMYRFSVTSGQVVDFDIDTPLNGPGGLGSYIRLFNAAGTQLAFNNDGTAPGENTVGFDAYLRFTFTTGGTYYIGVSNANNIQYNPLNGSGDTAGGSNATGSYTLTLQALPIDTDDSTSEATPLGPISTTPIIKDDGIVTDIDVDLYKFTVTAGQTVDFDIDTPTNGPGGLGSYLRLFNSQGTQIDFNNDGAAPGENTVGFDAYLRHMFTTGGTYYIGVSNANNIQYNPLTGNGDTSGGLYSIGPYELTVSLVTTPPADPDDQTSEAISLGALSTTPVIKNDSISIDTDVDMYKFTVTAGQVVDFDIDTTLNGPGGLGSYLRLFNSQGTQLAFNNDAAAPGENTVGFDAYLRFTFTTAGTYYIAVSNANNTNYDPNTGNGDTSGGLNATGSYTLTVQALPIDTDDSISEAILLGTLSTTPILKNDSINPDIDVDMYKFTVLTGQIVDFDIDTPLNGPGGLDSYIRIFNSQGQQVAFNGNAAAPDENQTGLDSYLRFTFTSGGTYYVGVSNANNIQYNPTTGAGDTAGGQNSIGSYQLSVSLVATAATDLDDAISEAIVLGTISTTPVTKTDSISPDTDVDMYRFTVTTGQVLDFDIDTPLNGPGGLGSYLRLFNAQGTQLAFNDDAAAPGETTVGFDAYLRFTFATAGAYYIGVSNNNNTQYDPITGNADTAGGANAAGGYTLTVEALPVDTDDAISEAIPLGALSTTAITKSDSINPDIDVDMYAFTVVASQTVDVDIDTTLNGQGGLGSYLRLFNSQGQQLAFNDNAAAPGETTVGFDAYLRFTFTNGGTYYIAVSNSNNTQYDPLTGNGDTAGGQNSIGSYQLTVQVVSTTTNDPDDSISEANPLPALSSSPTTVSASISPDTDVNMYKFTVAANQVVDFDIDTNLNGPGGLDSYVRLFDSTGTQLAFNNNEAAPGETLGLDAHLRYTFATAGTYYIAVSNSTNIHYDPISGNGDTAGGSNTTGSYQLIVQLIASDPDDTLAEATSLGALSATPQIRDDTISPDIDVDMYAFTVTAGQIVDFDIDTPLNGPGGLGSYLRLFNAQGQQLAFNNDAAAPGETTVGFDAYLRFTFDTAGTYYIAVSNFNNTQYDPISGTGDIPGGQNATGTYELTVQALPVDTNDSLSEATSLGALSTSPLPVNDSINPDIDVDLYSFTVNAGQVVDFDIDTSLNGPGGLNSFLWLFNSQGQPLTFNNDAAAPGETQLGFDSYIRFTFAAAGTYYVGVSNANNTQYNPLTGDGDIAGGQNSIGSYQLNVQVISTAPADPDDAISEANPLGAISTTPVNKSNSISPDTDVDMYAFTVAAGQAVDFDIDTTQNGPGGLNSYLRLFSAQGQQLAFNDNSAASGESTVGFDAHLQFTFTAAGTYYIGVSNSTNNHYDAVTGDGDTAGGANTTGAYQLIVQTAQASLALTISPSSIPERNGTATGTVKRNNSDLSQPLTVTLASSDPGAATVPASVVIPANQMSATFPISAVDDHVVGATRSTTITASAGGFVAGTQVLQVTDSDSIWQNPNNPFDVDNNGAVSPADALLVINYLNSFGAGPVPAGNPPPYYDVNSDNFITAIDALLVINKVNAGGNGEGEAAASPLAEMPAVTTTHVTGAPAAQPASSPSILYSPTTIDNQPSPLNPRTKPPASAVDDFFARLGRD